ncbi:unnamed protein product [Caenorhabditis auriculariae]|uniref:Uncharacterized protein n=1 Tax=Caenorhabditis auriculariae TaxID=2777116 RepID=A0A8S1HIH7_9PELO|nr:unnamed protein product [Caenorhabditis auriculariae]
MQQEQICVGKEGDVGTLLASIDKTLAEASADTRTWRICRPTQKKAKFLFCVGGTISSFTYILHGKKNVLINKSFVVRFENGRYLSDVLKRRTFNNQFVGIVLRRVLRDLVTGSCRQLQKTLRPTLDMLVHVAKAAAQPQIDIDELYPLNIHYILSWSRRNWMDYAQKDKTKDRKNMLSTLSTTRLDV